MEKNKPSAVLTTTDIRSEPAGHRGSADTHHSNRFTGQHLVSIHDDVISDIGQDIDDRDDGHGDGDGQGQIPEGDNTRSSVRSTTVASSSTVSNPVLQL